MFSFIRLTIYVYYGTIFSAYCVLKWGVILEEHKEQALISDEMSKKIIDAAEKLAISLGAENVTVRKVLKKLEITNRVFYNRFHNIDDVLNEVYKNMALKIRESVQSSFDPDKDFFEQAIDIVANTLTISYDIKMNFADYFFESDSASNKNYEWWKSFITGLIEFGKSRKYLKDIDADIMSYAIWCFIRGYNADAVKRKLNKEEAVENFKYSFGILLDGMKA